MHAGTRDPETIRYLTDLIKDPQQNKHEPILHGACLGLGLVGLASEDESNLLIKLKIFSKFINAFFEF